MNKPSGKQIIHSLNRGLIILETILQKGSVSITEMGKILDINKSSAYRLINTLEERGYVEQDKNTSKYRMGMGMVKFGIKTIEDLQIREVAQPYLKELTETTNESSHLCILFQSQALIIEQEISKEKITVKTHIGMSEPLHCSAVGKAILSWIPELRQQELLDDIELKAYTSKTITDPQLLKRELRRTFNRGFAIDDEEFSVGLRCIAAPVFNHIGEVIASIGISGPINRIRTDNLQHYTDAVVLTASKVSKKLGYIQ